MEKMSNKEIITRVVAFGVSLAAVYVIFRVASAGWSAGNK
jgi:hypothetical protein